jgi:hypothetical protein
MPRILEVAQRVLDEQGIRYEAIAGATALRFGFRTEQHQWACVVETREAEDLLLCVAVLPEGAPEGRRAAVAEVVARINIGLALGSFDLDYDGGEVRFRTAIDLEGAEAAPALVRTVIRSNLATVARNIGAIARVIAGAAPRAALAAPRA